MTDIQGSADGERGDLPGTADDAAAAERFAAIMRAPRRAALIGVVVVLASAAGNLFLLDDMSGPLWGVTVIAAVICLLAARNVVSFSPRVIARLQAAARDDGGRFALWKPGVGGHVGVPFVHGVEHERVGVLNATAHGMPIEIGHLSTQVSDRYRAPAGRLHAYAVLGLPENLPHMIVSFGHLSRVMGVRVAPEQWHRSQRLDVGFGRRARLFVAEDGEHLARTFFTPEAVRLLQKVGRSYDIEIRHRSLYLFAGRSVASGTERRWAEQRDLIDNLVASLTSSEVWPTVRRQGRGRGGRSGELRADVARSVAIVFGVAGVVTAVLSLIVLYAGGLLG